MKAFVFSLLTVSLMGCGQTTQAQQPGGARSLATPSSHSSSDSVSLILGHWSGSFEGASSGKLELTLRLDRGNHQISGQIVVMLTDGNRYSTRLDKALFSKHQLAVSYTEPEDGETVSLVGYLNGPVLKGNWTVSDGPDRGTWQAMRDETRIDPNEMDKFVGTYALFSDPSRTMVLTKEGDQLLADVSGTKLELVFSSEMDIYFGNVTPRATGKFVLDVDGVAKLIVSQNGLFEWIKKK